RTGAVFNPATGARTAEVGLASAEVVHEAARVAQDAQRGWRETGLGKRQQVMFRLREIVSSRAEELARIITAEHGKTVP
ncbi:aldehyde dehydrogenase family protein, partial [Streptomyces brasiliscabiei]|uniref:aldehyde dehydrogenase family protein n=1 Tax=Streptomyces brasiliscabiei TaxID=2736302 RepID=UPI0038F773E3